MVVSEPACVTLPVPLITTPTVRSLPPLRSNFSAALLVTAPAPSVPAVPPSVSVPPLMVVVPA